MTTNHRFQVGDYCTISMKGDFEVTGFDGENVTLRNLKNGDTITLPATFVDGGVTNYQEVGAPASAQWQTLGEDSYTQGEFAGYAVRLVSRECQDPKYGALVFEGGAVGDPIQTYQGGTPHEANQQAETYMRRNPITKAGG